MKKRWVYITPNFLIFSSNLEGYYMHQNIFREQDIQTYIMLLLKNGERIKFKNTSLINPNEFILMTQGSISVTVYYLQILIQTLQML